MKTVALLALTALLILGGCASLPGNPLPEHPDRWGICPVKEIQQPSSTP